MFLFTLKSNEQYIIEKLKSENFISQIEQIIMTKIGKLKQFILYINNLCY